MLPIAGTVLGGQRGDGGGTANDVASRQQPQVTAATTEGCAGFRYRGLVNLDLDLGGVVTLFDRRDLFLGRCGVGVDADLGVAELAVDVTFPALSRPTHVAVGVV